MKIICEIRRWHDERAEERRIGCPAGLSSGPHPIRRLWIHFILSRKMRAVGRGDQIGSILRKLL